LNHDGIHHYHPHFPLTTNPSQTFMCTTLPQPPHLQDLSTTSINYTHLPPTFLDASATQTTTPPRPIIHSPMHQTATVVFCTQTQCSYQAGSCHKPKETHIQNISRSTSQHACIAVVLNGYLHPFSSYVNLPENIEDHPKTHEAGRKVSTLCTQAESTQQQMSVFRL
jgi:hypothetical protein